MLVSEDQPSVRRTTFEVDRDEQKEEEKNKHTHMDQEFKPRQIENIRQLQNILSSTVARPSMLQPYGV